MSYGKRLQISFTSFAGVPFTFNIYKRDYTGEVDERDGCPPAVKVDWGDGANDTMPCLVGSKATVSFYSETQGEFSEFYAADNRQFYGELVDSYNMRYWRGWLVPEQRNEVLGYKSPVSLTFLDGIGELKNIEFVDGDTSGRMSYLQILLACLNTIESGMNVRMQVDFRPVGTSTTQCPFENMFVDVSIYEGLTCAEVLEQILAGCRLMQSFSLADSSYWLVQSYASLQHYATEVPSTNPNIELVTFESTPLGSVTLMGDAPDVRVDNDIIFHNNPPAFTNWSAWNYLEVKNTYTKIVDILKNGSFEDDLNNWNIYSENASIYSLSDMSKCLIIKNGNETQEITTPGYIHKAASQTITGIKQSASGMRFKFSYNIFEGKHGVGNGYLTVEFGIFLTTTGGQVMYGGLVWDPIVEKTVIKFAPTSADYDHWESGMWTKWQYYGIRVTEDMHLLVEEEERDGGQSKCYDTAHAEGLIDYEMMIQSIPADGSITVVFWPYIYANSNTYGDAYSDYNLIIDDVSLEFIDANYLDFPESSTVRIVNDVKCIENGEGFELLQGNVPVYDNRNSIYKSYISATDVNGTFIDKYITGLIATEYEYHELIARLLFSQHRRAALAVDFSLAVDSGIIPPHYVINDPNSSSESFIVPIAFTIDYENSEASGSGVAIMPFDSISTVTYTEGEQTSGSSRPQVGSDYKSGHPALTLAAGSAVELTLDPITQVANLNLSDFARHSEIPEIPEIHTALILDQASESDLSLNEETQVIKFVNSRKTFSSLDDTPSAYPVTGRGNGLIAGSANVFFADTYGSDSEGFWAKVVAEIESFGSDVIPNSHFNPSTGWTIGINWSLQTIGSAIWAVYESTGSTGSITQSVTLEAGKTYDVWLNGSSSSSRLIEVTIDGQTVATFPSTYSGSDDNKARFTQETSGTFVLGIKATFSGYLNVLAVNVFEINVTAGRGLRMVNSGHATQYILPTSAPAANDIVYARSDGQLVFGQLSKLIGNSDLLTDSDFPSAGLMKSDGAGNYTAVADNSETWNKAITDDDFASNGLMKRTAAGTYTAIADNSAAWNNAPVFVKLTAAAYTALSTEQKNNGTWYATY